jgi:hypothetical protein
MPRHETYCRQRAANFLREARLEACSAQRRSLLRTAAYWHSLAIRIESGSAAPSAGRAPSPGSRDIDGRA